MPNTYQIGRVGRVYAAKQSSYGTAPVFAATDAIRHLEVKLNANPRNRVDAPDRHTHPSLLARRTRRTTAEFSIGGIFFPSGVLNTLPDHSDFLECGMGALNNTTAATTVASGSTTTGATLASGTGMVVNRAIVINVTGHGNCVRWLASVAGAVVTWAPALPAAPTVGDSVKTCITYSLATALPNALSIGHYLTSVSKEGSGCVIDQLKIMVDANDEIRWEASGPMAERLTAAQAEPGAHTVVGTTPPSGLTATLRQGTAACEFLKYQITIANGMELDNFAAGTTKAQAYFRARRRKVEIELNAMFSDDVTIMTAAESTTDKTILVQCGNTEGSIVAVWTPAVEFDVPDYPDDDETNEHAFKGTCKGTTGNDEAYLAVA
jgi:hypothetical protein